MNLQKYLVELVCLRAPEGTLSSFRILKVPLPYLMLVSRDKGFQTKNNSLYNISNSLQQSHCLA